MPRLRSCRMGCLRRTKSFLSRQPRLKTQCGKGSPPMSLALTENQLTATTTFPEKRGVLVARKHHLLVRWSHWLNVPILLGLILSGMAIFWASPICQNAPDPQTGNFDYLADIGIWVCAHVPGLHHYNSPPDWIYNHMSLGPGMLGMALRLHWLCAYLFMLNGLV